MATMAVDIKIRTDLMLPVSIGRERDDTRVFTELKEVHARNAAPWQPTDSLRYEIIDFSDLGDRESDPFVRKVQALMPGGHGHAH